MSRKVGHLVTLSGDHDCHWGKKEKILVTHVATPPAKNKYVRYCTMWLQLVFYSVEEINHRLFT